MNKLHIISVIVMTVVLICTVSLSVYADVVEEPDFESEETAIASDTGTGKKPVTQNNYLKEYGIPVAILIASSVLLFVIVKVADRVKKSK